MNRARMATRGDRSPAYIGVLGEATLLATVMRHGVFVLVPVAYAMQVGHTVLGGCANAVLFVWALVRLCTRSTTVRFLIADAVLVQGYLAGASWFATAGDPDATNATFTVAGAMIISVAFSIPAWSSLSITALTMASWAYGTGDIPSLSEPFGIFVLDYLAVEWALSALVRRLVLRSARFIDTATEALSNARLSGEVAAARRGYERDQWALLHDTAASTLLMVGQNSARDQDRLATQAQRDLRALALVPETDDNEGSVDLIALLHPICAECATELHIIAPAQVDAPAAAAYAVAAATRECLTNVDRHAHANQVTVTVKKASVTIGDDGVGFAWSEDAIAARHGVRKSIIGRMDAVGGDAVVTTAPAKGTTVRLSWPPVSVRSGTGPDSEFTGIDRLLGSYGYALATVAVVVTLFGSIPLWSSHPEHPGAHAALMIANIGCALAATISKRSGPAMLVLLTAIVLLIAPIQQLLLDDAQLLGGANWSVGATGWTLAALTVRRRPTFALTLLAASWTLTGVALVAVLPTRATAVFLCHNVAGGAVVQALAMLFTALLTRTERHTRDLNNEYIDVRIRNAVASALQQDYRRRYRELSLAIVPLLTGLADRTLTPQDPVVRATALVEGARLRRLFAQSDSFDHPLLQELRPSIDIAENRGVSITFDVAADLPDLSDTVRSQLLAAPSILLADSRSYARIVITTTGDVTISLVCDCSSDARAAVENLRDSARFDLTALGEATWIEIHHDRRVEQEPA